LFLESCQLRTQYQHLYLIGLIPHIQKWNH